MNDINDNDEDVLDMTAINADIAAGARAYGELLKNVTEDWGRWTIIVRGLRALRDLAFAKAHTRDIKSWHYRQELSALLERRPYSVYSHIDKQTRSTCYKLMDRLDEICDWHKTLPANDQLRWKHPDFIAKHCPKHLLEGGLREHNKPKKTSQKKRASTAEEDRLRQLLLVIITEFVRPQNPARADELLKQVFPEGDPNDGLVGIFDAEQAEDAGMNVGAVFAEATEEGGS